MKWCSTSVRTGSRVLIEHLGVANCNDQIAARAFGALEHMPYEDFEYMKTYDAVFATMSKVWERDREPRWMDVLHRLKDETEVKVVLFQEAETPWPTTRPWEEQKSFIELLRKVDLFLVHNTRDIAMWGALTRGGASCFRWRTCIDLTVPTKVARHRIPGAPRPIIAGSSYDQRANGLMGLMACKDLGFPLWHQNRSTGYEDRTLELPYLLGTRIEKEIPHGTWFDWLTACSGAYLVVHPMPAASAGRDQICFAAMGIPVVGSVDLDIQVELFPLLAVPHYDVDSIRKKVNWIMHNDEAYEKVRLHALKMVRFYDLANAREQAQSIKHRMGWD